MGFIRKFVCLAALVFDIKPVYKAMSYEVAR